MAESKIENAVVNLKEELERSIDLEEIERLFWPVSEEEALKLPRSKMHRCCIINKSFDKLTLEYPDDINEKVSGSQSVKIGKPFDVISLLSCNGEMNYLNRNNVGYKIANKRHCEEQVLIEKTTFEDKYIIVCCFHAPFFHEDFSAYTAQGLATICSELYNKRADDFEMVLVVKTKINSRPIFDHFLSGFPDTCLVVPYEQSKCRDFICKSLDLQSSSTQCLIVDKDVQRRVLLHQIPDFVKDFGVDAFPFTESHCKKISEDYWGSLSMSSIHKLLGCKPNDVLELKEATGGKRRVDISELSKMVVGLYLCIEGDCMDIVDEMYRKCREKQMEFEVVVVYLPYEAAIDPVVFQEKIGRMLRDKGISWGCLSFDNSVSHRLWRYLRLRLGSGKVDLLLILDSRGGSLVVDPYGIEVFKRYGMDTYPFTREALVQIKLKEVKALTLESLLVYGSRDHVFRGYNNDKISVEELKGKPIILFFAPIYEFKLYNKLSVWYGNIKEKHPDFEVVFVIWTNYSRDGDQVIDITELTCLVCPFDHVHSDKVRDAILIRDSNGTLVEFGKDGHISSLRVQDLLTDHGPDGFPFPDDKLRHEVISYIDMTDPYLMYRFND